MNDAKESEILNKIKEIQELNNSLKNDVVELRRMYDNVFKALVYTIKAYGENDEVIIPLSLLIMESEEKVKGTTLEFEKGVTDFNYHIRVKNKKEC